MDFIFLIIVFTTLSEPRRTPQADLKHFCFIWHRILTFLSFLDSSSASLQPRELCRSPLFKQEARLYFFVGTQNLKGLFCSIPKLGIGKTILLFFHSDCCEMSPKTHCGLTIRQKIPSVISSSLLSFALYSFKGKGKDINRVTSRRRFWLL